MIVQQDCVTYKPVILMGGGEKMLGKFDWMFILPYFGAL